MAPLAWALVSAQPSETVAVLSESEGLNSQPRRGKESFGALWRFVVRCMQRQRNQLPTDTAAQSGNR
jgi:hypothetical protein